jgi:hypothetical protein
MKKRQFPRSRPDPLLEEVLEVLGTHEAYDLNGLFEIVHTKLRSRNAAHSGQEMLRLRTYEKLQGLMKDGAVKKTGKIYEAVPDRFEVLKKDFDEQSAKLRAVRDEAKKAA